jgi:aminoglycoside phosphotransferase (APT) family kinase protein
VPLAQGTPGCGFPWPWSVYRWLPGEPAATARPADPVAFAADLAGFLTALYRIDTAGGPPPGEHNFFREMDVLPSERARQQWARAKIAALAGASAWQNGTAASVPADE